MLTVCSSSEGANLTLAWVGGSSDKGGDVADANELIVFLSSTIGRFFGVIDETLLPPGTWRQTGLEETGSLAARVCQAVYGDPNTPGRLRDILELLQEQRTIGRDHTRSVERTKGGDTQIDIA